MSCRSAAISTLLAALVCVLVSACARSGGHTLPAGPYATVAACWLEDGALILADDVPDSTFQNPIYDSGRRALAADSQAPFP
ncbi:MAG: hypothetical protein IJ713_00735 [Oscillibacter sp.]|nr:hypothetical protein [Oscillibacter sp.]